jgi:methyl-accepting chemotaxis protein
MYVIRNVRIGIRLWSGFGLVLFCMAAVVAVGLAEMHSLQRGVTAIVDEQLEGLSDAMDMRETSGTIALALRRIAAPANADEGRQELDRLTQLLAAYDGEERRVALDMVDPAARKLQAVAAAQAAAVMPSIKKIAAEAATGNFFDAASALGAEFMPRYEGWHRALSALADYQRKKVRRTREMLSSEQRDASAAMLAGGMLALSLGLFLAWYITGSITGPLVDASRDADTMARGDLTASIAQGGGDEVGQLSSSLRAMQGNLAAAVCGIRHTAEVLDLSARDMAAGNRDLSLRTDDQADALRQTVAATSQLAQTVQQNAEHAALAAALAGAARMAALHGGQVVGEVVATMAALRQASHNIADIVGVIDGIAFQTKILALNAAIEAAGAGSHGRGFAVVAAQVQVLAQRAAAASKEIKLLIDASVGQVGQGVTLADGAGQAMGEIVAGIRQVDELIAEIALASGQQNDGLANIHRALRAIDDMTRKNTILVEASAASAQRVRDQSTLLLDTVAQFATGGEPPEPASQLRLSAPRATAPGRTDSFS